MVLSTFRVSPVGKVLKKESEHERSAWSLEDLSQRATPL